MKKILLFTLAASVFMHAVFAQGPFLSSWLIGLFGALILIMFAIFWLMKNQSPDVSTIQIGVDSSSPASTAHSEIHSQLKGMPPPKVHNEFFEVSSEHKPLPDDKMVVAQMRKKMDIAKKHGLPTKETVPKHIEQAVDEILQDEYERRKPEFRGEQKEPTLLAKYEAETHLYKQKEAKPAKKKKSSRKKSPAKKKSATKKKAPKKKKPASKSKKKKIKKKSPTKKKSPKTVAKSKKKSSKNKTKKKSPKKKKPVSKSTKKKTKKKAAKKKSPRKKKSHKKKSKLKKTKAKRKISKKKKSPRKKKPAKKKSKIKKTKKKAPVKKKPLKRKSSKKSKSKPKTRR